MTSFTKIIALRLKPGEDLREDIQKVANLNKVGAGWIAPALVV